MQPQSKQQPTGVSAPGKKKYGWANTIEEFIKVDASILLDYLNKQHQSSNQEPASQSQIEAWRNSIRVLKEQLPTLIASIPGSGSWVLVMEYELPRERGRRPDVLLLSPQEIFIIEFKDFQNPLQAHIDQVEAYARDIKNYHSMSHENPVIPVLLLTLARDTFTVDNQTSIISPNNLLRAIQSSHGDDSQFPKISPGQWIQGEYEPLPTLVAAARDIFAHKPLPQIRRAHSVGIPQTIEKLIQISEVAKSNNEHHLALVTGVPGAGKTLVGIQFVYNTHFGEGSTQQSAVFLSGNGPLVKVLQHALDNKIFVQDVHGFLKEYGGVSRSIPRESIIIFDEAQRAWDEQKVRDKRGESLSEPQDFLNIGCKKSWILMVGLIGEGQEIHIGEEAGLGQWNTAIAHSSEEWVVHCPANVASIFSNAKKVEVVQELGLTESIRTHLATDVQKWVHSLLNNNIDEARNLIPAIEAAGFNIYLTRNLEVAKNYVRTRYEGDLSKRYGLLASSKASNLSSRGIHNEYSYTKNFREGPWYNNPPSDRLSCCQLTEVATEFACQGLELDFPIICWGNDLIWMGTRGWQSVSQPRSKAHDPHQLRLNSYRVLLSRGRDGFIIYIPSEMPMDSTYNILIRAGATELQ